MPLLLQYFLISNTFLLVGWMYQAAATAVNGANANYLLVLGADLLLPMELMEGGGERQQ